MFWLKKIEPKYADVIIITANPWPAESKSLYVTTQALNSYKAEGVNYEILNLYDYHLPFRGDETKPHPEISKIFAKIDSYQYWLIVYPIWWSNQPAILKNFFDWLGFFSFKYVNHKPQGLLTSKKALIIAACSNNDRNYIQAQKIYLNNQLGQEVLEFCGVKVIGSLLISGTRKIERETLDNYVGKLKKLLDKMFI